MAERKSILEEAIIQMKNLEEAVSENAKGILASTMRQEIKELVKESLKEQDDEEEIDDEDDIDMMDDTEMNDEEDIDDEEEVDVEMGGDAYDMEDPDMDEPDMDDKTYDMTQDKMSNVLKVFKLMGPNDEIEVVSDDDENIRLKDNETDREYMIVKESDEDLNEDDTIYEIEMDEDDMSYMEPNESYMNEYDVTEDDDTDYMETDELYMNEYDVMEDDDIFGTDYMSGEGKEETIYEIEVDEDEEEFGIQSESKKINKGYKPSYSFSKNPNMEGGFKVIKKAVNKAMGTGSAKKFDYKSEVNIKGFSEKPKKSTTKKVETKEASRTLGNGKYWGREGLPKPKAAPRHLRVESTSDQEVKLLKEKNEEYRKALNIFRNKLNEVATFNSNLAYATRLFTEHTTSKQEKINILKRFDDVQTIKESKNLYRIIKEELETSKPKQVNESIERQIERVPTNGSAINLIESKTYENPQFLRMKDLMSKMK